jgi:PAS fold
MSKRTLTALSELFQVERQFSDFFNLSGVGLAAFDETARYRIVNPYLAASNRIPVEAHLGKHVNDVLGKVGLQVEPIIHQVFYTAQPVLNCEVAGALPTRPSGGHWIATFFPIADSNRKVKQVGVVVLELGNNIHLEVKPNSPPHPEMVLRSWKDIARYMGTSVKTVQRWEHAHAFPVRRVNPGKGSVVFAFPKEVHDWLRSRNLHAEALIPTKSLRG